MNLNCQHCNKPAYGQPIRPVLIGHLSGIPVHHWLCAVCAANHARRYTSRGHQPPTERHIK